MKRETKYELLTINGNILLTQSARATVDAIPELPVSGDTILSTIRYPSSALFDQILEQIKDETGANSTQGTALRDIWVYADFSEAFPLPDQYRPAFNCLFQNGFKLQFPEQEAPIHFVPLLSSASKSKHCVYGFIRKDLFEAMRRRLDLDFPFESRHIEAPPLSYLAKLYGYRALYSSDSTLAFRAKDHESFFDENNIIVLDEVVNNNKDFLVDVYTAEQACSSKNNEVIIHSCGVTKRSISLTCFDGEGLISPACAELINNHLPESMQGNSFQVRMPFFKGVLHTVDFHKFLREHKVDAPAYVKDAFGRQRDLFRANIIVTPSMLKLYSLLEEAPSDTMQTYFTKLKHYNHGLYIVRTERALHNTQYVTLNSQLITTLDLSDEDWDELVDAHCANADMYCAENLLDPQMHDELANVKNPDAWMTLLLRHPIFLRDAAIQELLKNYRKSRYNDIAVGHISVKGENRFLSCDLLYWLIQLVKLTRQGNVSGIEHRLLPRGTVYIPGNNTQTNQVALLRNPHLSRNETVCADIPKKGFLKYYNDYFKHLTGVVFVSYSSYIPTALGGADFDGDLVILSYDRHIIDACRRSGYYEVSNGSTVPFIKIPTLTSSFTCTVMGKYVSPQVVYNTFSDRIGRISNAAMKIAAVEYDTSLPMCNDLPTASLCTILTGTEIDAAKKGLRPNIDNVVSYSGSEHETHKAVVEEVKKFLENKDTLSELRGQIPDVKQVESGNIQWKKRNGKIVTLQPNRGHNPITQILYRWGAACVNFKNSNDVKIPDDMPELDSIFQETNPLAGTTGKILRAYARATAAYRVAHNKQAKILAKIAENNKLIFTRLKGQYDTLDDGSTFPIRRRVYRLQEDIAALASKYTISQIQDLCDILYCQTADTFWPYGVALKDNTIMNEILQLQDADLLTQFRFEGYRLLYYFLRNLIYTQEATECFPNDSGDNPYHAHYLRIAATEFQKGNSVSAFQKTLIDTVLNDLFDVLPCNSQEELIRKLYPPKTNEQKNAFWDIFTPRDMLQALGGDDDAQ